MFEDNDNAAAWIVLLAFAAVVILCAVVTR